MFLNNIEEQGRAYISIKSNINGYIAPLLFRILFPAIIYYIGIKRGLNKDKLAPLFFFILSVSILTTIFPQLYRLFNYLRLLEVVLCANVLYLIQHTESPRYRVAFPNLYILPILFVNYSEPSCKISILTTHPQLHEHSKIPTVLPVLFRFQSGNIRNERDDDAKSILPQRILIIMSHKNSLLFIGGVDKGHTPTNGETMKNQLYLDRFEEFFDIIHVIDTHNWKHRPWVFLQIPLYVLSFPHAKIFLSINRGLSLCRLLYYIGQSKRTYCSVVGGNLLEVLDKKNKITFLRFRI